MPARIAQWKSDTQFDYGSPTKSDVEIDGSGDSAYIRLAETVSPDVYAWWHLNESSGSNTADSSENGRDGTLINMEDGDWVAGKLNNCLAFDGVNEYVSFGDIANFERTDAFSVEVWFKADSIASTSIISRQSHLAPYAGWELGFAGNGKLRVYICNSYAGNCITVYNNTISFADGNWHHAIMTYDGSSSASGVHIYVDNVDLPLIEQFDSLTGSIQNSSICSIASRNGSLIFFPGYLDEVVIYEKELDSVEVARRWNDGNGTEEIPGFPSGGYETSGYYESIVYPPADESGGVYASSIAIDSTVPAGCALKIEARTANHVLEAVGYQEYTDGASIEQHGSFLQWKATLTGDGSATPSVNYIEISFHTAVGMENFTAADRTDLQTIEGREYFKAADRTQLQAARKMVQNDQELFPDGRYVTYEDDGTTVFDQQMVTDRDGQPITLELGVPARRKMA